MPNPYNLIPEFEGFHSFTTDQGLVYQIYCIDCNDQFGLDETHPCKILQFGFALESAPQEKPRYDCRIEETILSFIVDTLSNNRNCIIYAGSPMGNKEKSRIRLFEWWFHRSIDHLKDVEKHFRETEKKNQAVLLIKTDCEFKEQIVSLFQS